MPFSQPGRPLSATLKEATLAHHLRSEAALTPYLHTMDSRADYARLLTTFYGYFHPLEQQLRPFLAQGPMPDWQARLRSHKLLEDLRSIGQAQPQTEFCHRLPDIRSAAEAMGALYVLEGSTLGGRLITRMLLDNPKLQLEAGSLTYFAGHGAETGPKWRAFVTILDTFAPEAEAVIRSAADTFDTFTLWLSQTLTHATTH